MCMHICAQERRRLVCGIEPARARPARPVRRRAERRPPRNWRAVLPSAVAPSTSTPQPLPLSYFPTSTAPAIHRPPTPLWCALSPLRAGDAVTDAGGAAGLQPGTGLLQLRGAAGTAGTGGGRPPLVRRGQGRRREHRRWNRRDNWRGTRRGNRRWTRRFAAAACRRVLLLCGRRSRAALRQREPAGLGYGSVRVGASVRLSATLGVV